MTTVMGNLAHIVFHLLKNNNIYQIVYAHELSRNTVGRHTCDFILNIKNLSSANPDLFIKKFVRFTEILLAQLPHDDSNTDRLSFNTHIVVGRALFEIIDTTESVIEIDSRSFDGYLRIDQTDKKQIRKSIIQYVNSRYEELHDQPFMVYEILCSIKYKYEDIYYQLRYLSQENILSANLSKREAAVLDDYSFAIQNFGKGNDFGNALKLYLNDRQKTATQLVTDLREKYPFLDFSKCDKDFQNALENIEIDPSASIGHACSYIESIGKAILDCFDKPYPKDQSIEPLIKECSKSLDLSPDINADKEIRSINNSIANIAARIGTLRTHFSNFHGKGLHNTELDMRHARYIVNLAYSLSYFLIETFYETYKKKNPS